MIIILGESMDKRSKLIFVCKQVSSPSAKNCSLFCAFLLPYLLYNDNHVFEQLCERTAEKTPLSSQTRAHTHTYIPNTWSPGISGHLRTWLNHPIRVTIRGHPKRWRPHGKRALSIHQRQTPQHNPAHTKMCDPASASASGQPQIPECM